MTRFLIVHATVGGGHTRAAEAIAEAAHARAIDCALADYDDLVPGWQRAPIQALYRWSLGRAPGLWRAYYRHTNRPAPTQVAAALAAAGVDAAAALIERTRPDAIISTFTGAAALIGASLARRGARIPHLVVATDFLPHRHWVRAGVDGWCVPAPVSADALIALGAPAERVSVTGLPVRRAISHARIAAARAATIARFELDPRPIVVIAAGAEPTTRAHRVVAAFAGLRTPCNLLVCHDAPIPPTRPGVRVVPVGLTAAFPMLLAGADLLVGKAGGATVAEACALGRAMVIVDPYPGQEEDNATWLARHDAALCTRGPASAVVAVDAVLGSTRLRSRLADAARALGRPRAADTVVERALAHLAAPLALAS